MTESEFWKNVKVTSDNNDCWEWNRSITSSGYGIVEINNKLISTHRYSFLLYYRYLPKQVNHLCSNRLCCNPLHLYDGNQKDNMYDAHKLGSIVIGSKRKTAKLVEQDIPKIRRMLLQNFTQTTIGNIYGVSSQTISSIKLNKTWTHVPETSTKRFPRKE